MKATEKNAEAENTRFKKNTELSESTGGEFAVLIRNGIDLKKPPALSFKSSIRQISIVKIKNKYNRSAYTPPACPIGRAKYRPELPAAGIGDRM